MRNFFLSFRIQSDYFAESSHGPVRWGPPAWRGGREEEFRKMKNELGTHGALQRSSKKKKKLKCAGGEKVVSHLIYMGRVHKNVEFLKCKTRFSEPKSKLILKRDVIPLSTCF